MVTINNCFFNKCKSGIEKNKFSTSEQILLED